MNAQDNGCEITVLLPTFNEGGHIRELARSVEQCLAGLGVTWEILVVDGDSSDNTREVLKDAPVRFTIQTRPGYAGAIAEGFQLARGRCVIVMDADMSHPPELIRTVYENRHLADILIGSRFVPGADFQTSGLRKMLSHILNMMYDKVVHTGVKDVSSGFRMYPRAFVKSVEITSTSFEAVEEILIKAITAGFTCAEVPLKYCPRASGYSKARVFKFGVRILKTMVKMWGMRNSAAAADYDSRAFDSIVVPQRMWQRGKFKIVMRMLGGEPSLVDLACGSSRIGQTHKGICMDISQPKLRVMRRAGKSCVRAALPYLPFKDRAFKIVFSTDVIEHIPNTKALFKEIERIAQHGGTVILGTPDFNRLSWNITEFFYDILMPFAYGEEHCTHYSNKSLREEMRKVGLRIQRSVYLFGSSLFVVSRRVDSVK